MEHRLELAILPQPDQVTCGPTCLHAVYQYYGDNIDLSTLIKEIPTIEGGGTLAVHLGQHALQRGYYATMYTFNLDVFDPSWFRRETNLQDKLLRRAQVTDKPKLQAAALAYRDYVAMGGEILWQDLTPSLIRRYLQRKKPILTGLSATYLYGCPREVGNEVMFYDDVRGQPQGHFVVLRGYMATNTTVNIADPYGPDIDWASGEIVLPETHYYDIHIAKVICAIMLGVFTYDGNLLIIEPKKRQKPNLG